MGPKLRLISPFTSWGEKPCPEIDTREIRFITAKTRGEMVLNILNEH